MSHSLCDNAFDVIDTNFWACKVGFCCECNSMTHTTTTMKKGKKNFIVGGGEDFYGQCFLVTMVPVMIGL